MTTRWDPIYLVTRVRGSALLLRHQRSGVIRRANRENVLLANPDAAWDNIPRRPRNLVGHPQDRPQVLINQPCENNGDNVAMPPDLPLPGDPVAVDDAPADDQEINDQTSDHADDRMSDQDPEPPRPPPPVPAKARAQPRGRLPKRRHVTPPPVPQRQPQRQCRRPSPVPPYPGYSRPVTRAQAPPTLADAPRPKVQLTAYQHAVERGHLLKKSRQTISL